MARASLTPRSPSAPHPNVPPSYSSQWPGTLELGRIPSPDPNPNPNQGPGTLELDQIAPNYALRMLMEAWIAALAATGATVPATRHA